MRYLVLVLRDYTYQYLDRVLTDVKLSGIKIVPVKVMPGDEAVKDSGHMQALYEEMLNEALDVSNKEHSYIMTDDPVGAKLASDHDIGYVYCDISYDCVNDTHETLDRTETFAKPQCIIQGFDEINADFLIKMYKRFHHLPWTILSTKRLILREMTVDDVDRLYEIYGGEGITDYTEPLYEDKQQEIEYTRDYIRNMYELCGYGLWIVIEKPEGSLANAYEQALGSRIVGRAGITGREGYDEAELGYVIEKDRQGRRYASEICRAIVDYARDVLRMNGLNCFVHPENEASIKLCKLLNFEYVEDVCLSGCDLMRYHLSF